MSFIIELCLTKRGLSIIAHNEKVFIKKGKFGTRQPVTDAGFCSKVELLPTAS
ncbi:hypothetical protein [Emticicia sp.]|uniref:hypothetical protein n=1 Tax=Emticicia sp. TaxID=1930953 RepID=UPI003752F5B1